MLFDVLFSQTFGAAAAGYGGGYTFYALRLNLGWGLMAFIAWRFDQRFARWLVPAPKPGHCPKCGYSLQGIAGSPICPECGADLRPPPPPASA